MNGVAWNEGASRMSRILHTMAYEHQLAEQAKPELQVPERVTIRWLFRHVPITLWLSIVAVAGAVFLGGYACATPSAGAVGPT